MKVKQFIKSLNNTEIGKGGTHENYVLVSKKIKDIDSIFDSKNLTPKLINLKNGGIIDTVHITIGNEFRINGLGDFYRDNNVNAGDEIIFERHDNNDKTEFFINLNIKKNSIIFQKNSKGFEALNIDRLKFLMNNRDRYENKIIYHNKYGDIIIKFKESAKKRSDSPNFTDFYSIFFNGHDILNDLKTKEYFELTYRDKDMILKKIIVWQVFEFNI